jgi:hypothetical protein
MMPLLGEDEQWEQEQMVSFLALANGYLAAK